MIVTTQSLPDSATIAIGKLGKQSHKAKLSDSRCISEGLQAAKPFQETRRSGPPERARPGLLEFPLVEPDRRRREHLAPLLEDDDAVVGEARGTRPARLHLRRGDAEPHLGQHLPLVRGSSQGQPGLRAALRLRDLQGGERCQIRPSSFMKTRLM